MLLLNKKNHILIEHCFFAGSHMPATTYRPDKLKAEARYCSPPTFPGEHNLNGDKRLLQTIYKFPFNNNCVVRGGCVKEFALNLFDVITVGAAAAHTSSHAIVHAEFVKLNGTNAWRTRITMPCHGLECFNDSRLQHHKHVEFWIVSVFFLLSAEHIRGCNDGINSRVLAMEKVWLQI